MAIKDQCLQCIRFESGICEITGSSPNYNQMSCESYKKKGINLEKFEVTESNIVSPTSNEGQYVRVEKQRMFSSPFSFQGRIRRKEYGLSIIIVYIYAIVIGNFVGAANGSDGIIYLLLIPDYWFMWAQGAKRCHDRDNSGWYQIIPLYGFWMLFADGDAHKNRYGQDPKGRNIPL